MVASLGGVEDLRVLDLYAGSGSFGLEALSRGAANVEFVEQDRTAASFIDRNLETLGFGDRAVVRCTTVEAALAARPTADVAFCDPPYAIDPWATVFEMVTADLVVGHSERPVELPEGWEDVRRRTYGRSQIVIARRVTNAQ